MSGFDAMTDSDLILCVNLLHADARDYEQMIDNQAILRERAADRRALAARMKAEVDRRDTERWGRAEPDPTAPPSTQRPVRPLVEKR